MDLLFNKNGTGIDELRKYLSGLYASQEFGVLKGYLENATGDLIKMISQAVYDKASTHYQSGNFEDGSHADDDLLVYLVQDPVAKKAYLEYAPVSDLKNDGNGRRMHVDESSKAPWEWMIRNADEAVFRQYHKAVNRLLEHLENKKPSEWTNSDPYKERKSLLCSAPADIDPINQSHWFFARTKVFNREAQEDKVLPVIGLSRYEEIIGKLKQASDLSEEEKRLVAIGKKLIRHLVMIRACYEFPVEFLPEGTVQRYVGDREGKRASVPANEQMLERAAHYHRTEAKRHLAALEERVKQIKLANQTYTPSEKPAPEKRKFFRP